MQYRRKTALVCEAFFTFLAKSCRVIGNGIASMNIVMQAVFGLWEVMARPNSETHTCIEIDHP